MRPSDSWLESSRQRVEAAMDRFLPALDHQPGRLHEAMRYSVFAGGKRLRPALCYAAFEDCGGVGESADRGAVALEMVHTFSLIHDDLPCMDDDDFRRGRPTCHRVYGEAMAVLAGDALAIAAFGILGGSGNARAVEVLAAALGSDGMLGGQVVDIESEGRRVDLETVRYIHNAKTAALIEASLVLGAVLAGADGDRLQPYRVYGRATGLAFQIVDDLLDLTQTTETLGKDAGSDLRRQKATWPAVAGLEASRAEALRLMLQAEEACRQMPIHGAILADLARFIVERAN